MCYFHLQDGDINSRFHQNDGAYLLVQLYPEWEPPPPQGGIRLFWELPKTGTITKMLN
jgi:hypothetical protein